MNDEKLTDEDWRLIAKVQDMDMAGVEREPVVAFQLLAIVEKLAGDHPLVRHYKNEMAKYATWF